VEQRYRSVTLVRSGQNLGFAGGANLGSRKSAGDILVFLNNDVQLSRNWLKTMVSTIQEMGPAVVGGNVFFADKPFLLNHAGGMFSLLGSGYDVGFGSRYDEFSRPAHETGYVSGAALMIPRQIFNELGGFSEDYFLYCEDVDLCWRAWLQGRRVLLQPEAVAYHKLRASQIGEGDYYVRLYHWHKNALANTLKNFEATLMVQGLVLHGLLQAGRVLSAFRWSSAWRILYLLRSDIWLMRNLSRLFRLRVLVQSSRRVSDGSLARFFLSLQATLASSRNMFMEPET